MIDKRTGNVTIAGTIFWPMMSKDLFERSILWPEVIRVDTTLNGYTGFYIKPQRIDGVFFLVQLYFDPQNKLIRISFRRLDDDDVSVKKVSEQKELENKRLNDKLLTKILGTPPYKYEWGEVKSGYDIRSTTSGISIRYSSSSES